MVESVHKRLEQANRSLLESALAFKTLVTRKRCRTNAAEQDRVRIKRRALENDKSHAVSVAQTTQEILDQQQLGAAAMLDAVDIEDNLVRNIHRLKEQLFDRTVETQQALVMAHRIRLAQVAQKQAECERQHVLVQNEQKTDKSGFNERDKLVSKVLQLYYQMSRLRQVDLQVQRELLETQNTARALWSDRSGVASNNQPKSAQEKSAECKLQHENIWLEHCLTTVALEAKLNIAKDPVLRQLLT